MIERNLIITGMMGVGKSSVARSAAQKLGWPLIDTDVEIEKRFGKKIAAIFQEEGESVFRKAEFELCSEIASKSGVVVATGGGFLVPVRSLRLLDAHSVFCLDANANTIVDRTKHRQHRPLLSGVVEQVAIQQILNEREAAYQRIFHHVQTDQRSILSISGEVIDRFNLDLEFSKTKTRFIRMPLVSPYPIGVAEGAAFQIPLRLKWAGISADRILIVTNEKLHSLYQEKIEQSCSHAQLDCKWLLIPDGEEHKTLATVELLYKNLLSLKAKRDDILVAFGGGVVGDIAGFVAATYMRGLRLIQVPTSLLAMVDSSIGGKTGVDLAEGKNLVGAFKQPLMVLSDPSLLETLPIEELRSGMAEVIKHAIINDAVLFEELSEGVNLEYEDLVFRALKVKADIVEEDPYEHGMRAVLNLGHTFGHAIEKVSDYQVRHGYAVAIGLVLACKLAYQLKLCDGILQDRVEKVLKRFELPTHVSGMSADQIVNAMQHDKKGGALGLRFVVPHGIGRVRLHLVDDLQKLRNVLAQKKSELTL